MEIKCTYEMLVPIDELIPNPKNPNKHSKEQIKRMVKVIQYNGFRRPIVVSNQSGFVVVGHGRIMAARELGMRELPVDFQDYDSSDAEYADMIADNALQSAELDFYEINLEIPNLGLQDIGLLGIKDFEVDVSMKDPKPKKKKEVSCPSCGHVF